MLGNTTVACGKHYFVSIATEEDQLLESWPTFIENHEHKVTV